MVLSNVCDALVYILENIFIRFGTKLYRQTIDIPMGTYCAPLVTDLFLFCHERDFMKSLSRENQGKTRQTLLNKTETPNILSVVCSLFPKAIFLTFISIPLLDTFMNY